MFEIGVPVQLGSGEDCFLCFLMATLLLHPCKVKRGSYFPLLVRALIPPWRIPSITSLIINYLLKVPSLNTITLRVSALAYEFGRGTQIFSL